jgi:bifunctional non-homologous end joining protein LigD
LKKYQQMRDFAKTPEPAGARGTTGPTEPAPATTTDPEPPAIPATAATPERLFVVQRHRARRTHYDFRLEVDGVLASWAMPKGPSLDPSVRSLAVHVEDHPFEYRDFEGVIPKGQYGGGDVIVWDTGTWVPGKEDQKADPAAAIANGELHFDLDGQKLAGRFVLVRTRMEGKQEQWLMLHKHDDHAVDGWRPDDHPQSVKSGRTNDEVAADPDFEWHSDRPAASAAVSTRAHPTGPLEQRHLPVWQPPTADELAALDDLPDKGGTWLFQGKELKLTNLDKVLFPAAQPVAKPRSKRDLIRYYSLVAPAMLPYLYDRPVNLNRFPNGVDRPGFWHKQAPGYAPDWLTRWDNPKADKGESETYFIVDSPPALAWMGNYGAVELHPWTSTAADSTRPTWALIDIDPGPATTPYDVLVLARLYRAGLDHLHITGQPKLTGSRGIHIWVPIDPSYTFHDTSAWVEKLSRAVGATVPDLVSWVWRKDDRSGLARLDFTQNARNKTLVAPYSVRPATGAPVSMPVTWDELDDDDLRSDRWTIDTAPARLAETGDLYRPLLDLPQRLPTL